MRKTVRSETGKSVRKGIPSSSHVSTDHPVIDGPVMTTRDETHLPLEHNQYVPERIDLQAMKKIWHSAKVDTEDMPDTGFGSNRPSDDLELASDAVDGFNCLGRDPQAIFCAQRK